jgi:ferredoxin-fold anticodon binding domain-containing protein
MEPYKYDPLDPKRLSTRIIKLKPSSDFNASIYCEVLVIELHTTKDTTKHPDYEAVSYTWEGQTASPNHFILCRSANGEFKKLDITENSEAGLRRMRSTREDRHLWMDSICINQKCTEEKNDQVAKMGYIYTGAKKVLVWLGENLTRDTRLTLTYIKTISRLHRSEPANRSQLQSIFEDIRKGDIQVYP